MTRRVALVTGGMGGIGSAVCRRLASMNGNAVVANCLPAYERKDEWLGRMRAEGFENVHAAEGDVADYESAGAMVRRIESEIGPVDILVNNAGIVRDNMLKKMSPSDWLSVINTNLNSAFNVTKHVIDGMTERGWGRIVNLSSVNGQKGQFGQTNYSAAKAGVHGFAKALAQEVVRKGVTVNSISPGYVETDMVKAIRKDVLDKIVAGIPMGRLAKPEEIAALIAFLTSDEAGYITGANIAINGGMYMS
ncbi:MAG: acetoacetyl-CoA reductase [Sphingomonadaceae bacterium]|jgi:acetoacetyl-CoA reductase